MGVAKRAWPWAKCPKIEIFYPNFFQYLGPPECKSKVRPRVPRRLYGIFARYRSKTKPQKNTTERPTHSDTHHTQSLSCLIENEFIIVSFQHLLESVYFTDTAY